MYVTHRTSTELPWGPTTLVPELNSGSDEAGLHLSSDGLTLWFASARPGGAGMHDIYRTTRPSLTSPFDPPARVIELCSTMPEHNASVDDGELTVVMSRGLMPRELYGSQRPDRASAWRPPVVIPEISSASDDEANPSLSPDGLTVYFATDRQSGNKDLWTTTRPTISDPFAAPVPVDGVNSTAGEYQAWVSADAHVIYFSSDRSGTTSIYRATR